MYSLFRDLAIIILSAKFFGLVARKCKAPQVVGEIIAGLLIGPCLLNLVQISDSISIFAEIGVVMLMFTTGLGTNLKELIKAGPIATLIATVGVAVPLVGGTLLYGAFYGFAAVGSPEFYRALFIGTQNTGKHHDADDVINDSGADDGSAQKTLQVTKLLQSSHRDGHAGSGHDSADEQRTVELRAAHCGKAVERTI